MATKIMLEAADTGSRVLRNKKPDPKHDNLHNFEVFSHCWCMCARCWMPHLGNKGRCICADCPCEKNLALLSRVPAPVSEHALASGKDFVKLSSRLG